MSKKHGENRFSVENGYEAVTKIEHLDKIFLLEFTKLRELIKQQADKLDEQEKTIQALKAERVVSGGGGGGGGNSGNATASNLSSYAAAVRSTPVRTAADVMDLVVKERKLAESKETNLVISGFSENKDSAADEASLIRLLKDVKLIEEDDDDKPDCKFWRAGKQARADGKPRLLFVAVGLKQHRNDFVEIAKKELKKNQKYAHVFIQPDKTKHELLLEYELRKKRDELNAKLPHGSGATRYDTESDGQKWYWGVRWGEIKQIDKTTGKVLPSRTTNRA